MASAITSHHASSFEPTPPTDSIPPLEAGDRLTRPEFERRYDAMPELKNAELVEGVVYMGSPVNHVRHGKPHFHVNGWLNLYRFATIPVDGGDNSSLRLDLDNMPQPDAFLYNLPSCGGQVRIAEDGYIEAAPELIAEVASSSVSYDMNSKLHAYRRNGVKEYVVWRVRDHVVNWFTSEAGEFVSQSPGADGIYRSLILPGLWLDPVALIRDNRAAMLRVNAQGTTSPEHAAFVARLRAAERPEG